MRQYRRWPPCVFSGVFILLFAGFWATDIAYWKSVYYALPPSDDMAQRTFHLTADCDGLTFRVEESQDMDPAYRPTSGWRFDIEHAVPGMNGILTRFGPNHQMLGFSCGVWPCLGYQDGIPQPVSRVTAYAFTAPHWFPVFVAAIPLVRAWARHWRIAYRLTRNRCSICNYDLRSTPERCPECGLVCIASGGTKPSGQGPSDVLQHLKEPTLLSP